jgi:small subunit ribosomal protein S18
MSFERNQNSRGESRGEGRNESRGDARGGEGRGEYGAAPMGGAGGFRRRKTCPFSGAGAPVIDYKDVKLLQRFVTERGKIIPARISAVSLIKQRELSQAIKRARYMALMPFAAVGPTQERD